MSSGDRYLCVSPQDRVVVSEKGLVWHTPSSAQDLGADLSKRVFVGTVVEETSECGKSWAVRAPLLQGTADLRELAFSVDAAPVYRAVALLRHRERYQFDPTDGSPLKYSETGDSAIGFSGREIYPRIDPAVIGIVEHVESARILVARNALRPEFFSLIAGYVSVGESLEAAFAREVLEETGRRVRDVRYVDSQPWPTSSSLMIGFHGFSIDIEAVGPTDGELSEIRWVGAGDILDGKIPLAPAGSLAHSMIYDWAKRGA